MRNFKLIMIAPNSFTCIIDSVEGRDVILMNGLWFLGGNVIGLEK